MIYTKEIIVSVLRKKFSLLFSLLAITALVSCGGADTKNEGGDLVEGLNTDGIELNGDSDLGTAGGLKTVYFDFNSSQITGDSRERLESNAKLLGMVEAITVQIAGHADERGSVQYNLALGQKRANSVRDLLIALGVDGSRISTVSYGKERPLEFGHDETSWGKNRRGSFIVTAK
jgi:peptidoglycan-associated lipoprotein